MKIYMEISIYTCRLRNIKEQEGCHHVDRNIYSQLFIEFHQ